MQERIFWGACKSVLKSFYVFFFYVLFFGAIFKQFVRNFHSSSQLCHESFLAKYGILKMKFSAERLLVLDGWSWLCRMTSWTNKYSEKKTSEMEVALLHKEHLGTSRNIQEHLGTSGNIWEHLGTSRSIQKPSCIILDHLSFIQNG